MIVFYKDLIINPLWFELKAGSNETLLLFDNGVGRESEMEGNRILVFGSKVHLHLLLRSLDMMGDGTFDVCPYIGKEKFYQLVSIRLLTSLKIYILNFSTPWLGLSETPHLLYFVF